MKKNTTQYKSKSKSIDLARVKTNDQINNTIFKSKYKLYKYITMTDRFII